MPNFIISGIPGVDVGADTARAAVQKRIDAEAQALYEPANDLTVGYAIQQIAEEIAEELKDATAAVDVAFAAGGKGESRVMVAYMTATNNQNAIQDIQRERAGA
jgi:hypothetical protein